MVLPQPGGIATQGQCLWGSRRDVERSWQREREPEVAEGDLVSWHYARHLTTNVFTGVAVGLGLVDRGTQNLRLPYKVPTVNRRPYDNGRGGLRRLDERLVIRSCRLCGRRPRRLHHLRGPRQTTR